MRLPDEASVAGTRLVRPEAAIALAAVRSASLLCRAVRQDFHAHLAVAKEDRSPVTVADLGAQVVVSLALAEALPGDPLMGEEDARQLRADPVIADGVARAVEAVLPGLDAATTDAALERGRDAGGPGRRWWTLDPVDGTKGFLRDEQYAVALALVEDGVPQVAVLGCPNLPTGDRRGIGCLFVAERGGGAWEMTLDDPGAPPRPIAVDGDPDPARARQTESVEAAHSDRDISTRVALRLRLSTAPLRMDSQAKYAVVARGDASIYLRIPHGDYREHIWDHAAGLLVVQEAGGVVTDVDGRALDLTTGRRMTANRGIVATPPAIAPAVLAAVRAAMAR